MKKFIAYEKMSKKAQKELNAQKRTMWECKPVAKVIPNKKKEVRWSKSNALCY